VAIEQALQHGPTPFAALKILVLSLTDDRKIAVSLMVIAVRGFCTNQISGRLVTLPSAFCFNWREFLIGKRVGSDEQVVDYWLGRVVRMGNARRR
jgi:hypothetical protein